MCIGKWHVGDQPDFRQHKQGFESLFRDSLSNDMQKKSLANGKSVVPLLRDDKVIELLADEDQSRIVERYTKESGRVHPNHNDRPFFLYLPHNAVHTPIWPGEAFRGSRPMVVLGIGSKKWIGRSGNLRSFEPMEIEGKDASDFFERQWSLVIKGRMVKCAPFARWKREYLGRGRPRSHSRMVARKNSPGSQCNAVAGTIDLLPTAVSVSGGTLPKSR